MKRFLSFFTIGIFLGILFIKSEVISWYRIYEMFRFESFHMYGIIGTAVISGILIIAYLKRRGIKTIDGNPISLPETPLNWKRHLLAGTIFGLGWALVGACPGPIFALLGAGKGIFVVVLSGALLGAIAYGKVEKRDKGICG
ncbi:MAG: DUF6691 family protein [Saprospiraceae bacterium]